MALDITFPRSVGSSPCGFLTVGIAMTASDDSAKARSKAGKLVTIWRTVQQLDKEAWVNSRDMAPLRFVRWLGALGVVIWFWDSQGTPHDATTWLPVLAIIAVLLLPDAASIGLGAFSFQARQSASDAAAAADSAQAAAATLELKISVATQAGEAAGESAQARSVPAEPADEALRRYLCP